MKYSRFPAALIVLLSTACAALRAEVLDGDVEQRRNDAKILWDRDPSKIQRGLGETYHFSDGSRMTIYELDDEKDEIASMIMRLKSDEVEKRRLCARLLWRGGTRAVPALAGALNDEDAKVRYNAAISLGQIGPDAFSAFTMLVKMFNDDSLSVRHCAMWALIKVAPHRIESLQPFMDALQDEDPVVRFCAARGLGKSGFATFEAVAALSKALNDDDPDVRMYAAYALGGFGSGAEDAARQLALAIRDNNPDVRRAARWALKRVKTK